MDKVQNTNNRLHITKNIFLITASILTILAVAYSLLQHNKIMSLEKEVRSLNDTAKRITDKNSALNSENADMKKAVLALQTQIKVNEEVAHVDKPLTAKQASKMTITNVSHQLITVPANEYHGPLSTDYFAVRIALTNQSESNQIYDTSNFYALTESGAVVKMPSFGPGIEQTVWTRSELAPGGHMEVSLLFPASQNITTLTMTIPGTSDQLVATLPTQT